MSTPKISNVRIETDRKIDEKPPYIYSPYPETIVMVEEGDTRGEREVIELINENWPATINELEEIASEEYGGYSGSFIRNVLRSKYIPAETLGPAEVVEEEAEIPEADNPEDTEWHKIFRLGIRSGIEFSEISEDDAFEAFGSGFVEGKKLKGEMDL